MTPTPTSRPADSVDHVDLDGLMDHVTTVVVDGSPVRLLDIGSGPVVVGVPGIASTPWDWVPLALRLQGDMRVIVVDRAGYAPGEQVSSELPTLAGEAARLVGTLEACGVTEPVTLVGHSFGAATVEAVARSFPERVRGLVLLDGSVPEGESSRMPHDEDAHANRRHRRWSPEAVLRLLSSAPARTVWRGIGPLVWLALAPGRLRVRRAVPTRHRAARVRGPRADATTPNALPAVARDLMAYEPCMAELRHLRGDAPLRADLDVLVVAANGYLPRRGWSAWVRTVLAQADQLGREGDVRTVVLRRCGHFVMLGQTRRVAELLRDATR